MKRALAELFHNAVAHPLLACAKVAVTLAGLLERGTTWLHDATAEKAWPPEPEPDDDGG